MLKPRSSPEDPQPPAPVNLPEAPSPSFPEYLAKKYPEIVRAFEDQRIFNRQLLELLREKL